MRSKFLMSAVVAVAVLGMALPAGAATPINGTGKVHCQITGTIKFNPPLVNGGTGTGHVTVKAKLASCTGGTGDGAHVVSASSVGSATTTNHDCNDLAGPQASNLTSTVKWKVSKGSSKLNPSTVKYDTTTGGTSGSHATFDATGSSPAAGVTAGSFKNDDASAHAIITETIATILGACGKKGVKTLHIGAGSTADVTP